MPNSGITTSRSLNTALTGPCCPAIESSRVSVTGRTSALPVADPSQTKLSHQTKKYDLKSKHCEAPDTI